MGMCVTRRSPWYAQAGLPQITTRIDALSSIFVASLAMYLLYGPNKIDPSNVGFSLSMAVGFSGMILFWVRIVNDLEGRKSFDFAMLVN
jgi:hypothetical protein